MMRTALILLVLGLMPTLLNAQDAQPLAEGVGPQGEAYLDALGRRSVETDVTYFDPDAPAPPFETDEEPEVEDIETPEAGQSTGTDPLMVLAVFLLIGLALFALRAGGFLSLSFGDAPRNEGIARRRQKIEAAPAREVMPRDLRDILAIADRRDALIALARTALERTVTANGILFRESWTARDALRRLPPAQRSLAALRALVSAAEGAQFGDRNVSEAEFEAHLDAVRPLLMKAQT